MTWFSKSTRRSSGWRACIPARASFTTSSGLLISFFMLISFFNRLRRRTGSKLSPLLRLKRRSLFTFDSRLFDLFDSTHFSTTRLSCSCYEFINNHAKDCTYDRTYNVDDEVGQVICATKSELDYTGPIVRAGLRLTFVMGPNAAISPATIRPMIRPAQPLGARPSTAVPIITKRRKKVPIASIAVATKYPVVAALKLVAPYPRVAAAEVP